MLFSGGRILVAAAGAIVLVVVAIYAVRSVWWDPTSKSERLTLPTAATTATVTGLPETTAAGDTGAGADTGGGAGTGGGEGGGEGGGGETSSSSSTSESSTDKAPFTATTEHVRRFLGTVLANVELPQVEGGDQQVADVFNDEMETALQSQADSVTGGTLESRPGSGVRIGERVLSGVLRTAAVDVVEGQSTALASTVVVDAESGSLITLSSLFDDLPTGLEKLREEAEKLGPDTTLGTDFDSSGLEPTEDVFRNWTAETSGMHLFFDEGLVGPAAAGVVELTVPWEDLSEVMKPGVAEIVSS